MTRIGIYGGTFSPPHNGHLMAAKLFMEQMWLDFLYIIPAAVPPHKEMERAVDPAHRLEMCRLAFAGMEGVYVSDMEIARGGKSFTVDTLRELAHPDRRLFLLCGTDMVLTLGEWRAPEEIFRLSYPVYIRRDNDRSLDAPIVEKIAEYHQKYGKVVRRIVCEPMELSSHDVRAAIAMEKSLQDMVPASVEAYIREHHLYK